MKLSKFVILSALVSFLSFGISGCEKSSTNLTHEFFSNANATDKDYDICIYNSHCEYSNIFSKIISQYESESGVKVKVISSTSYENAEDHLHIQKTKPANFALFSVNGLSELNDLEKAVKISNLSSLGNTQLQEMLRSIPSEFHLSFNQTDNYGIPLCLVAKSYFIDKTLVEEMFGKINAQEFLSDLSEASYSDFSEFISKTSKYLNNDFPYPVSINKHSYKFQEKTDRIKKISNIFSKTLIDETINSFLALSFQSEYDVLNANREKITSLPFSQLIDVIKLQQNFSKQNSTSEDSLIKSAYDIISCEYKGNAVPIPIKFPLDNNSSPVNDSICIASNGYLVFNSKSSPKEKKLAEEFILWLCNNQDTLLCKFNKTAFAEENIEKYTQSKKTFNTTVYGLPVGLTSYISQHSVESNTEKFSDYVKNKWFNLI